MYLFVFIMMIFCSASCQPKYHDFFPYHDDGTVKPNISLLPIVNHSNDSLPWDPTEELSTNMRFLFMQRGNLYIPPKNVIQKQLAQISTEKNVNLTTTQDLTPFTHFAPARFVVVMELIEHQVVPYKRGAIQPIYPSSIPEDEAAVLCLKLRLRVVDIRSAAPKVVRQEIIESNHVVSINVLEDAIARHRTSTYGATQLAIAYARFCEDLVVKVERLPCFRK